MDDVRLSINVLAGFLSREAIIHCLRALSQGHGVYFRLFLAVLLTALDVRVDLLYKEEIFHFLVDVRSCGWDRDRDILMTLYCNTDVLGIGTLPPGIDLQGLVGCSKLIRLVSRSLVVDVPLEVLC